MGCGSSVPEVTVGVSTSVLFSVWRRCHGRAFAIECSIDSFNICTLSTNLFYPLATNLLVERVNNGVDEKYKKGVDDKKGF